MKKIIAILLSVICLFSVFAVAVSAADDEGATLLYGISYDIETAGVKVMYSPTVSLKFPGEGYTVVTKDTPIAIDHDFVCWKDENGKFYYEGDRIYVNGLVTLSAVWEEKTNNYPKTIRVIMCALLTMERMMLKVFGVVKDVYEFEPSTPTV